MDDERQKLAMERCLDRKDWLFVNSAFGSAVTELYFSNIIIKKLVTSDG